MDSLTDIRETAERAARAAGRLQLEGFRRETAVDAVRRHDLKLAVDRLSEETIIRIIAGAFPDHGILAEETGYRPGPSDRLWIIDPLDGSVNYYHGMPCFCVSVACYARSYSSAATGDAVKASMGEAIVGVVYVPVFDELFCGVRGEGATCNGRPVAVGMDTAVEDAVVAISLGNREETMERMCAMSASLVRDVRKLRMFGSTALDLTAVACGRMSALVQGRVRPWDFAAGRLILQESGGVFEAVEVDSDGWEIIACTPGLYPYLKGVAGSANGTDRTLRSG